jgi:hypothetical protein
LAVKIKARKKTTKCAQTNILEETMVVEEIRGELKKVLKPNKN